MLYNVCKKLCDTAPCQTTLRHAMPCHAMLKTDVDEKKVGNPDSFNIVVGIIDGGKRPLLIAVERREESRNRQI